MRNTSNLEALLSTIDERIKHTPKNRPGKAHWNGQRGNSTYVVEPEQTKLLTQLKKFHLNGIPYVNGVVDFHCCSIVTVILPNMDTRRYKNFSECDRLCAILWNQTGYLGYDKWTRHLVANYRKNRHYSWHERNDRLRCDLVPTLIHSFFNHLGGISECKLAKNLHKT